MIEKLKLFLQKPYNILWVITIFTLIFALFSDSPQAIFSGLIKIMCSRGVLITDYIEVGGVGATLFNASLTGILILTIYRKLHLKANGSLIMAFWLCFGFSFFGKTIINMTPIIFGGYLYSKYKKEDFMWYSLTAILSTTLAPMINEFYYIGLFPYAILNFIFSVLAGILVGFIMIPIAISTMKAHSGFNLYNVGFAAGILGILVMGSLRAFDLALPAQTLHWNTSNTGLLSIYAISISIFLIVIGLLLAVEPRTHLEKIYKSSGRLVSDYFILHKESAYINMGALGLFSLSYLLILGGDVNGPTLGAIFTIIGFGCFGKHLRNVLPVMIGATFAGYLTKWDITSPSIILGILFSTGLAPVAGTFSIKLWKLRFNDGIIAGMLHILVVTNVGSVHGGLNLYNNGFAAGFVAMILVPILTTFRKGDFN